ncbi:MAG: hypothetical protein FWC36_11075 [Spirochaetes bacterium]|nr:hypothetical protein [Spirochaetota bacterium]
MPNDAEKGINLIIFLKNNLSLIILLCAIFCIPAFWKNKRTNSVLKYFAIALLLSLLLSGAAIFFPFKSQAVSFEVESGRFYTSGRNIIFADKVQDNQLSGVIVSKRDFPGSRIGTFSGIYSVSDDKLLRIQGIDDRFIVGEPGFPGKFFGFLIKHSSFMAESVGKSGNSDLLTTFIKAFAIIATISSISFFLSTGKWPLINYFFSQSLIFCFLWFNYFIQKTPFPGFLQPIKNLIFFDPGSYYFAYIVISFSVLLIKILLLMKPGPGAKQKART